MLVRLFRSKRRHFITTSHRHKLFSTRVFTWGHGNEGQLGKQCYHFYHFLPSSVCDDVVCESFMIHDHDKAADDV